MEVSSKPGVKQVQDTCGIRLVLSGPISLLIETLISSLFSSLESGSEESQAVFRTKGSGIGRNDSAVIQEFLNMQVNVIISVTQDRSFIRVLNGKNAARVVGRLLSLREDFDLLLTMLEFLSLEFQSSCTLLLHELILSFDHSKQRCLLTRLGSGDAPLVPFFSPIFTCFPIATRRAGRGPVRIRCTRRSDVEGLRRRPRWSTTVRSSENVASRGIG